jgi:CubicO group peptidase (beta-lactamase class C family)
MPRPAAASAREAALSLRTRDLAKLGELVLQHGRSGTGQVVPAEWIDASRQLAAVGALTATGPLGYGDLWWVGQLQGRTLVLAWGYGGQRIAVFPELDLIVVTTARWQGIGSAAPAQVEGIIGWIGGSVVPAARIR